MDDIIKLTKSEVSYLNYQSNGKILTKNSLFSEDGYLAIHHGNSILIGTIGFQPDSHNRKLILNQEKVEIHFSYNYSLYIRDCSFKNVIHDNKTSENNYQIILSGNYAFHHNDKHDYIRIDWSPLYNIVNKSYLAVMNFDGRIIIIGHNQCENIWEKEFDMLEMYYEFYKGNLLISSCDENGIITCTDINEYIQVKNDLKLISFSWGSLMRQSDHNQYCLIALLSESGIVTVWRIVNEQFKCKCEIIHCFRLDKQCGVPKTIQFCDISNDRYLISVFYSNEKIVAYPYMIISGKDNKISVESLSNAFTINDQLKYSQVKKIVWSMKIRTLIVGYESELLFAEIEGSNENDLSASVFWLELPSDDEISGIAVRENIVYVTTHDGCLFAVKTDPNTDNIMLNEITFETPELNGNVDFISAFISPNAVHLGFVKIDGNKFTKRDNETTRCEIVFISIMPENELFYLLMDDNKPLCWKQDALEELRHKYINRKINYHEALLKLLKLGEDDEEKSLYNLQLARYLCMFFGYPLNVYHRISESKHRHLEIEKIRKLETIIISRNISYWLEGFCDLSVSDTNKDDCFFVLSVSGKLKSIPHKADIVETIEAAQIRSRYLLETEFGVLSAEIENFESLNTKSFCRICGENCEFNLFANKCSRNHLIPRCCKSLELCDGDFKVCGLCGANDTVIYGEGISDWRLEIANSNCPLCDGRFRNI